MGENVVFVEELCHAEVMMKFQNMYLTGYIVNGCVSR